MMIYIIITDFVLISYLEKDHSMIETRRLENSVIFFQTMLSFVLSTNIIFKKDFLSNISFQFTI